MYTKKEEEHLLCVIKKGKWCIFTAPLTRFFRQVTINKEIP